MAASILCHRAAMPRPRHPGFPARPILRPGVRLCRREDGRIQIGLAADLAVTAPDTPEVHALIDGLRNGVAPEPPLALGHDLRRLCAELLDARLVLDSDELLVTLGRATSQEHRESVSAYFCDNVTGAAAVLAGRRDVPVALTHHGFPRAARRLRDLLAAAGVDLEGEPGLGVHISRGEPPREMFDDWLRKDLPHVLLVSSEGRVTAGPFVEPGVTACLRCLDAHHTDHDPRRPLILAQYAAATAPRDGLPEPVHHDLLEMAVLWLGRDIVNWIDGRTPQTWSSTVTFDAGLDLPHQRWTQHPSCGCGWSRVVALGARA
jgi:bacteriocin biosynthesis cyclodehydratase domain-containing protein